MAKHQSKGRFCLASFWKGQAKDCIIEHNIDLTVKQDLFRKSILGGKDLYDYVEINHKEFYKRSIYLLNNQTNTVENGLYWLQPCGVENTVEHKEENTVMHLVRHPRLPQGSSAVHTYIYVQGQNSNWETNREGDKGYEYQEPHIYLCSAPETASTVGKHPLQWINTTQEDMFHLMYDRVFSRKEW